MTLCNPNYKYGMVLSIQYLLYTLSPTSGMTNIQHGRCMHNGLMVCCIRILIFEHSLLLVIPQAYSVRYLHLLACLNIIYQPKASWNEVL